MLIIAVNRALRQAGWYNHSGRSEPDLLRWLDLVALGTVCDVVPLTGLNRAFVAQGPDAAKTLREQLRRDLGDDLATTIEKLLVGYTAKEAKALLALGTVDLSHPHRCERLEMRRQRSPRRKIAARRRQPRASAACQQRTDQQHRPA